MAWIHLQNGNHSNTVAGLTDVVPLGQVVSVGDFIVAEIGAFSVSAPAPTLTLLDSLGNVYSQASHFVSVSQTIDVWYTVATVGGTGNVLTATANKSAFLGMNVDGYNPGGAVSVLTPAGAVPNTVSPSTGLLTVSGNCLIVAAITQTSSTSANPFGAGAGFNLRAVANFVPGTTAGFAAEDQLNVTVSEAATFTMAVAAISQIAGVAFQSTPFPTLLRNPTVAMGPRRPASRYKVVPAFLPATPLGAILQGATARSALGRNPTRAGQARGGILPATPPVAILRAATVRSDLGRHPARAGLVRGGVLTTPSAGTILRAATVRADLGRNPTRSGLVRGGMLTPTSAAPMPPVISLTLKPSLQRDYTSTPAGAFLLTFTVIEATGADPAIFLHLAHPKLPHEALPRASFQKICLPLDLQQFPPNDPYPWADPPWFRMPSATLAFRSRREALDCSQLVMVQVQQLLNALDVMGTLVAGTPVVLTARVPAASWVTIG